MENFISDWVWVLLIVVAVVALIVLLSLRQPHKQESAKAPPDLMSEEFPVVTPVVNPRIKLRKKSVAQTKFRRRQILGNPPAMFPAAGVATPTVPAATPVVTPPIANPFVTVNPEPNGKPAGPKIKRREIKISLDAIHKVTGIAMRECPCPECQEMRANVGS